MLPLDHIISPLRQAHQVDTVSSPILRMRKRRLQGVKALAQGEELTSGLKYTLRPTCKPLFICSSDLECPYYCDAP